MCIHQYVLDMNHLIEHIVRHYGIAVVYRLITNYNFLNSYFFLHNHQKQILMGWYVLCMVSVVEGK